MIGCMRWGADHRRRVAIVGRVRLFLAGLAALLEANCNVEVVAQRWPNDQGVLQLSDLDRDVVILVQVTSGADSAALQSQLRVAPGARLVAVGVPQQDDLVVACAEAGVCGYVQADSTVDDLVDAIDAALQDHPLIPPSIAAALLRHVAAHAGQLNSDDARPRLTRREIEIVQCLRQNMTNKEIAHRLNIDVSTVKNHIHSVLHKLGVERRMQAAAANPI